MWDAIFSTLAKGAVDLLTSSNDKSSAKSSSNDDSKAMPAMAALMTPPPPPKQLLETPNHKVGPGFAGSGIPKPSFTPEGQSYMVQSDLIHTDPMELTRRWISYLGDNN